MKTKYEFELLGRFSNNKLYGGLHWSTRAKVAREWHEFYFYLAKEQGAKLIEHYPVSVTYEFHFRNQPMDSSNCVGMVKLIEDALKGVLWTDDDPRHINKLTIVVAPELQKGFKEKVVIKIEENKL